MVKARLPIDESQHPQVERMRLTDREKRHDFDSAIAWVLQFHVRAPALPNGWAWRLGVGLQAVNDRRPVRALPDFAATAFVRLLPVLGLQSFISLYNIL
jgi:hypothetical protein